MYERFTQFIVTLWERIRRHRKVAAYAILSVAGITAAMLFAVFLPTQFTFAPGWVQEDTIYTISASRPVRITIPTIDVVAEFEEPLTLEEDKTIGIPEKYTTVGWYEGSPTPGELGPAIVLGHVDSYKGPAVFHRLPGLEVGDTFSIEREDGSQPQFVVEKLEWYSQDDFPTKKVYGPIDHAGIRLITCAGDYDHGTLRYSHNLVVYGRLLDPTTAP